MSFLDDVTQGVRKNIEAGHYEVHQTVRRDDTGLSNNFISALTQRFTIIAEIKPTSPSAGALYSGNIESLAHAYASGGAGALSVLCEGTRFGGKPHNLALARTAGLPLLAKDFVVSKRQLQAYATYGADAVLMIQELFDRKMTDEPRDDMIQAAHELGLAVLLEAHACDAVEMALQSNADAVGINNRNLDDLGMNPVHYLNVRSEIGPKTAAFKPLIAESGFATKQDVDMARQNGFAGVLVGTSLLKSADAQAAVRALQ